MRQKITKLAHAHILPQVAENQAIFKNRRKLKGNEQHKRNTKKGEKEEERRGLKRYKKREERAQIKKNVSSRFVERFFVCMCVCVGSRRQQCVLAFCARGGGDRGG